MILSRCAGALASEDTDDEDDVEYDEENKKCVLEEDAKYMDTLNHHICGIYAMAKQIDRPVHVIVVDLGQINPIAYVHATIRLDGLEIGDPQVVTETEFHTARGTQALVHKTREHRRCSRH